MLFPISGSLFRQIVYHLSRIMDWIDSKVFKDIRIRIRRYKKDVCMLLTL